MMSSSQNVKLAALLATAAGLAGCAAPKTLNTSFGNATAHNIAMHIIDPTPADPNLPAPDMNGQRAFGALDRYLKGQTIQPERLTTTR